MELTKITKMNAAFHYIVRAKLIRFNAEKEVDFLEFEEVFENENPIMARYDAFNHFQNYIDVLLDAKNKKYTTDKEAREHLKSFYQFDSKLNLAGHYVDFSNNVGFGIGIFLKINNPIQQKWGTDEKFDILNDKEGQELLIHSIGQLSNLAEDTDSLIFDLSTELEYYKHYNYNTDNEEIEVLYCNSGDWENVGEALPYEILPTPFDWSGYEEPWWEEYDAEKEHYSEDAPGTYEEVIRGGESNFVEFKPALLYNFKTGIGGISVKGIIAKTICAFLNSNGGVLFIGVGDDGELQGIDNDFKLSNGKNPKDFFQLEFDQMIQHFLSFSSKSNIVGRFYESEGKTIFIVTVSPSKNRPIFLKGLTGKEFYVRGEASTRQLTDIEEIVNYCRERWST